MSTLVIGLVLFSAILHSSWNAIAKVIPDRLASATMIGLVYLIAGAIGIFVFEFPASEAWPYIIASVIIQTAYLILLTTAYKYGEFSYTYPLARGLAVLGVTVVSVGFLGENLSVNQAIGVGIVIASLGTLVLAGKRASGRKGTIYAVLTGVAIASYTVVDGLGVRLSGTPLGYASWLFLLQGITIPLVGLLASPDRSEFFAVLRSHWRIGTLGGVLSFVAYGIIVWAQSVAPLAVVSALRETSVLFAGVIGVLFFHERLGPIRSMALIAAICGIATIHL